MLLNATLCTEKNIRDEWDARKLDNGQEFNHVDYFDGMTEEQRTAFSLLMDYGVISVISKGVQRINCFEAVTPEGRIFLDELNKYSKRGLVKIIAKKSGKNINALTIDIWKHCVDGDLRLISSPSKAIFYTIHKELTDDIVEQIIADQTEKKELRVKAFEHFAEGIEAGETAEQLVKEALDI